MAVEQIGFNGTNSDPLPPAWTSFFTASGSANIQSNAAKLTTPSTTGSFSRMYYRRHVQDIEILVKVTPGQAWTTDAFTSVGLRDINNGNGRLYFELDSANAKLSQNDGTTTTVLTTVAHGLTGTGAIWVRYRNLGRHKAMAKWWLTSAAEPADWKITHAGVQLTGASQINIGKICPWFQSANSSTVAGVAAASFSDITIDDLRPIKAALTFRRF